MLTAAFVAEVQRVAQSPASMSDTDILAAGNSVIRARVTPLLREVGSNFLVRNVTVALSSTGRARLPKRAVGAALRLVEYQYNAQWLPLPLIALERAALYPSQPRAVGYYLDAGAVVTVPAASGSVRLTYEARPSAMALSTTTSLVAPLTAITVGATTTALEATASTISTALGLDVVSGGAAHELLAEAATVSVGAGPTYTAANTALGDTPVIGDWVAFPEYTPFVPVPEELTAAVVQLACAEALGSLGYLQEAQRAQDLGEAALAIGRTALVPRNEGNPTRWTGGIRRSTRGAWRW